MEDVGQEPRNAGVLVRGKRRSESFVVMRGVATETRGCSDSRKRS